MSSRTGVINLPSHAIDEYWWVGAIAAKPLVLWPAFYNYARFLFPLLPEDTCGPADIETVDLILPGRFRAIAEAVVEQSRRGNGVAL